MGGRTKYFGLWTSIVVAFVLDRVAKLAALTLWSQEPVQLLPGVRLEFLLNSGIAFSLPFTGVFALVVTLVVVLALLFWLGRAVQSKEMLLVTALLFVLAGATSNIADRFLYGGVIDYLALWLLPVLNLADLAIVVGFLMIAFRPHKAPVIVDGSRS